MAQIKIGVIGLGGIANGAHLPGITASGDLALTALCDIDEGKLRQAAERYHIDKDRCFTDYRDLIAHGGVDAVDICTPNDVHFPIAMAAVAAKKHYSVEKPVSLNAKDTGVLAKATEEAGLKSMVCFSYRFKAAARYTRELVRSGVLGHIYHISMQYLQSWGLPGANSPLAWRFIKERAGSGALGDLGCHALDLVSFITGKAYTKVVSDAETFVKERTLPGGKGTGKADVDDFCNYMTRMEGGATANFQISRFSYGRGNYQRLEIYGEKGALVYKLDETPGKDELETCIEKPSGNPFASTVYTTVPIPAGYAVSQMQCFADLLNNKGDGTTADIKDGLENQKILDALITSFEEGRWISLA
jgi:predicted dehydrogenase